jgi:hypothetical protein
MKGQIMSALLEKLVLYTVEPNTPDNDLREKAIGIFLKGGREFDSVVVDRFDDEIAAVLAPKSSTLFVGQGS